MKKIKLNKKQLLLSAFFVFVVLIAIAGYGYKTTVLAKTKAASACKFCEIKSNSIQEYKRCIYNLNPDKCVIVDVHSSDLSLVDALSQSIE